MDIFLLSETYEKSSSFKPIIYMATTEIIRYDISLSKARRDVSVTTPFCQLRTLVNFLEKDVFVQKPTTSRYHHETLNHTHCEILDIRVFPKLNRNSANLGI